jgi:transcriptional regulator with XRE-family HTH domain
MTPLARTARFVRDRRRLTQRAAAEALGVSHVHLCNVERGKATPSPALVERFRALFGVDLHVLAWCLFEDDAQVPEGIRGLRTRLAQAWEQELADSARTGTGRPKMGKSKGSARVG